MRGSRGGHRLEFICLTGGCTGSSESTLVKMPHCWKLRVAIEDWAIIVFTVTQLYQHDKGSNSMPVFHNLISGIRVLDVSDVLEFIPSFPDRFRLAPSTFRAQQAHNFDSTLIQR